MKILMCPPEYFRVEYSINPWMSREREVDCSLAHQQWQYLHDTIESLGADVQLIEPHPDYPDMVFTANAAVIHGKTSIVARFTHPERQGESMLFKAWFEHHGFLTIDAIEELEGAGDALFVGEKLFLAYGFRGKAGNHQLRDICHTDPITVQLSNPYFYHLDTCFCPLDHKTAIWYPAAFTEESQQKIRQSINLIDICDAEAHLFACNAVVIGNNVILPAGCIKTASQLKDAGFGSHFCDTSEFMLAGGSCKCLTLVVS